MFSSVARQSYGCIIPTSACFNHLNIRPFSLGNRELQVASSRLHSRENFLNRTGKHPHAPSCYYLRVPLYASSGTIPFSSNTTQHSLSRSPGLLFPASCDAAIQDRSKSIRRAASPPFALLWTHPRDRSPGEKARWTDDGRRWKNETFSFFFFPSRTVTFSFSFNVVQPERARNTLMTRPLALQGASPTRTLDAVNKEKQKQNKERGTHASNSTALHTGRAAVTLVQGDVGPRIIGHCRCDQTEIPALPGVANRPKSALSPPPPHERDP
ncbi:unnamed protein product [Diplocarpon coronariae]